LYLFNVEVPPESDPAGQYAPNLRILNVTSGPDWKPDAEVPHTFPIVGDNKVIEIRVGFLDVTPDFAAAPYECVINVRSSGGVRQVRIPALKPMTDAELAAWPDKVKLMQAANCPPLIAPLWDLGSLHDSWSNGGDPPAGTPAVQVWEFGAGGLNPGDILTLTSDSFGLQATGIASAGGLAQVSALVPADSQSGMTLARSLGSWEMTNAPGFLGSGAAGQGRGLAVRKSLLVLRSNIPLRAECDFLEGIPGPAGEALLLSVSRFGLEVYDTSVPAAPMLRQRLVVAGLKGVARWGRRSFLLWGENGYDIIPMFGATSRLPGLRKPGVCTPRGRRNRAAILGGAVAEFPAASVFAAVGANGITVYQGSDDGICKAGAYSAAAREVAFASRLLIALRDGGIDCVDLSDPGKPSAVGVYQASDVSRLADPAVMSRRPAIGLETAGGGIVLDLSNPAHPVQMVRTRNAPWFSGLVRIGHVFAHLDGNRASVSVYENEARVEEIRR
jgi:hypothetical protein